MILSIVMTDLMVGVFAILPTPSSSALLVDEDSDVSVAADSKQALRFKLRIIIRYIKIGECK